MPYIDFHPNRIPLDDKWDVTVVGGGPAGCTAAAAAAREGARTLLVESTGVLGGSGTSALVPAWCPFSDREKIIYRGLAWKVFENARSGMAHVGKDWVDWTPIDAERLKTVYDSLVLDNGAEIVFHTTLSSLEKSDDGTVSAIVVTNKSGLSALKSKVYVDCTGDADLCAWAGAEFAKGNTTGKLMPATHCFTLTNVVEEAFRNIHGNGTLLESYYPDSPIYEIVRSGKYPLIDDPHMCCTKVGPGTVGFNAGHIVGVDNTDPETVSKALVIGRRAAAQYRDALAKFCPEAFGNAFLVSTASVVGIRETRRIVGDYVLTLDDYLNRRTFDDEICRNSYFLDVHQSREEISADQYPRVRYAPGESHGIPYRCLTPAGLKNVLVAGRSISCDRPVQGSVRVMPVCLAMGEGAGLAAAIAASGDKDVHKVDTNYLREKLKSNGAYLP